MNATNAIVTVDTRDAEVHHHVTHEDGMVTFKVHQGPHAVTVYLIGTVESVSTFAHTLARAVADFAVDEVERATIGSGR